MRVDAPPDSCPVTLESMGRSWTFLRPADPDAILDSIPEDAYARDRFLPYWAEIWPATEVLLAHLGEIVPPRPVTACDLGCGLGILGAILAAHGHATLAIDMAPSACRYAAANLSRHAAGRAHVVCGDWRHLRLRARFDLIIAADVLYEPRWVGPVLAFLKRHVAPGGLACIADPRRASWGAFMDAAAGDGFETRIAASAPVGRGGNADICLLRKA